MNIAVLFGGISPERNVSITGGKAVVEALSEKGYNVVPVDPAFGVNGQTEAQKLVESNELPPLEQYKEFDTKNIIDCINSNLFDDIDLAFLVLHGINGEDGKIQALLQLRNIPYTGSSIKSSALSIDKISSKMLFSAAGILTPQWVEVSPNDFEDFDFLNQVRVELGKKLVIKPNNQGSTIGISIIDSGNLDDIKDALLKAAAYSDSVFIEQYIEGQEITIGIVGEDILPAIEIVPEGGYYDYEHKYTKGKTKYICPTDIGEDIESFTQDMAHLAFQTLGCRGFARADFRLNDEGQPYLLEMNTIPGFTPTSLVPMAAKQIGLEFSELCAKIINITLNKKEDTENE